MVVRWLGYNAPTTEQKNAAIAFVRGSDVLDSLPPCEVSHNSLPTSTSPSTCDGMQSVCQCYVIRWLTYHIWEMLQVWPRPFPWYLGGRAWEQGYVIPKFWVWPVCPLPMYHFLNGTLLSQRKHNSLQLAKWLACMCKIHYIFVIIHNPLYPCGGALNRCFILPDIV